MRSIRILILITVLTYFLSCSNGRLDVDLKNALSDLHIQLENRSSVVLVVPFDGCLLCFNHALELVPLVQQSDGVVIFSALHKKRIVNTIIDNTLSEKNIYLDTNMLMVHKHIVDMNPTIFFLEKDKVVKMFTVEKDNMKAIQNELR